MHSHYFKYRGKGFGIWWLEIAIFSDVVNPRYKSSVSRDIISPKDLESTNAIPHMKCIRGQVSGKEVLREKPYSNICCISVR